MRTIHAPRRVSTLALVTAVAVLTAGCTAGRTPSSGAASAGSAVYQDELAYAHCMQSHGLPDFPDPDPSGNLDGSGPGGPAVVVGEADGPAARAAAACRHLLPGGASAAATTSGPPGAADCLAASSCYAPHQFRVAYGIQPLLDSGISGRGATVVLPEEAETGPARPQPVTKILQSVTDIRQDLADFDGRFGLPPAQIQVTTTLAGASASPWLAGVEEVEDTELVHAVAPDATIRELLVDPADVQTPAKLATAFDTWVRLAAGTGDVISQSGMGQDFNVGESSWTSAEVATMHSALQYAADRHVTVVVATGDYGAIGHGSATPAKEVSLPASDPLALAAGGTTLTADAATGAYHGETAWNTLPANSDGHSSGSGGGFSKLFARPAYQDGTPGIGAARGVPDVAGDAASGDGGMALAFTAPGGGGEFVGAGGTSAAAPFWAGLIALADQKAGHSLGDVNPAIYQIARGPQYHQAFHDITVGNNTVTVNGKTVTGYQAGPGWDPVTGWGSPDAQVLIPLLAEHG